MPTYLGRKRDEILARCASERGVKPTHSLACRAWDWASISETYAQGPRAGFESNAKINDRIIDQAVARPGGSGASVEE